MHLASKRFQGRKHKKHYPSSNDKPPISTTSAAFIAITLILLMSKTLYGITILYLPGGDTITYPSNCPSIRTIVRRIEELNYLVKVHLFPNNDIWNFPIQYGRLLVTTKETLLYIVPFPPIPILQSAPRLTSIAVTRALRQAIHKISTGVTSISLTPWPATMKRQKKVSPRARQTTPINLVPDPALGLLPSLIPSQDAPPVQQTHQNPPQIHLN